MTFTEYAASYDTPSILDELLWNRVSGSIGKRPSKWRAPSWSWASIDGEIQTRSYLHPHGKFDVLRIHTELLTHVDPFGEVTSGFIVLKGQFTRMCLSRHCHRIHVEKGFTQLLDACNDGLRSWRQHPLHPSCNGELLLDVGGPDQELEADIAEHVWCLRVAYKLSFVLVEDSELKPSQPFPKAHSPNATGLRKFHRLGIISLGRADALFEDAAVEEIRIL